MTANHNAQGPGELVFQHVDAPLTLNDVVRYQGASGDLNPLHHDPEAAAKAGFDQPIVVGMLPAGIAAALVVDHVGSDALLSFEARFERPAWPGDVLTYCCTQEATPDRADADGATGGGETRRLQVLVSRADGEVHLRASAVVTR